MHPSSVRLLAMHPPVKAQHPVITTNKSWALSRGGGWLFVLTSLVGCVSQDAAFTVTVYIHKCRRKATTSVDPYAYFGRYRAHYKPIRQIMFGIRVDSDFPRLLSLGEDRMLVSAVKWAGDCWLNYCLRQSRRIILFLYLFFSFLFVHKITKKIVDQFTFITLSLTIYRSFAFFSRLKTHLFHKSFPP